MYQIVLRTSPPYYPSVSWYFTFENTHDYSTITCAGNVQLNLQPNFENSLVNGKRFNYFDLELLRVSRN